MVGKECEVWLGMVKTSAEESGKFIRELRKTLFFNGLRIEWRESWLMFLGRYGIIGVFCFSAFISVLLVSSAPEPPAFLLFLVLICGEIFFLTATARGGAYQLTFFRRSDVAFLYLSSLDRAGIARNNIRKNVLLIVFFSLVLFLVLFPTMVRSGRLDTLFLFFLLALLCWNFNALMLGFSIEVLGRVETGMTPALRGLSLLRRSIFLPFFFLFLGLFLDQAMLLLQGYGLFMVLLTPPIYWLWRTRISPSLHLGWYEPEAMVTPELVPDGYRENREIPPRKGRLQKAIFDHHFFKMREDRSGWDAVKDAFGVVAQRRTFGLGWPASFFLALTLILFFVSEEHADLQFLLFFLGTPVLTIGVFSFLAYRFPNLSGQERQFLYLIPVPGEELALGMLKGFTIFLGIGFLLTVVPGVFVLADEPILSLLVAVHALLGAILMAACLVVHGECAGTRRRNIFDTMDGSWMDVLVELAAFSLVFPYLVGSIFLLLTFWGNWLLFSLLWLFFICFTLLLIRLFIKKAGEAYENRSIARSRGS